MVDIDDSQQLKPQTILKVAPEEVIVPKEFIYRVSWIINDRRKEVFFKHRSWAETFVDKLLAASQLLHVQVTPLIGDVEVNNE